MTNAKRPAKQSSATGARAGADAISRNADAAAQAASNAADRAADGIESAAGKASEMAQEARNAASEAYRRAEDVYERAADGIEQGYHRARDETVSAAHTVDRGTRRAGRQVSDFVDEHPLMVGVIGFATGLVVGALLPRAFGSNGNKGWRTGGPDRTGDWSAGDESHARHTHRFEDIEQRSDAPSGHGGGAGRTSAAEHTSSGH